MAEGEAQITPQKQEYQNPEGNALSRLNGLFRLVGMVTHDSPIRSVDKTWNRLSEKAPIAQNRGIERSASLRTTRAHLLEEYRRIPKENAEGRKKLITEAHQRDEIAAQFLNQGNVKITIGELGEQSAKYTILNPKSEANPPIFFIPGISNDLSCVEALSQELAYKTGRKVYVVGMIDSIEGQATQKFADAISKSPDFGPYAEFFKGAINALTESSKIELWGHSTGGPLITEILNDPRFQSKVINAVLLNPASSANISIPELVSGITNEFKNIISKNMPKYTLSADRWGKGVIDKIADLVLKKSPTQTEVQDEQQRKIKGSINSTMMKKVCSIEDSWKAAKVKNGGKIVVYSGRQDYMTRSSEVFKGDDQSMAYLKQQNPQLEVIDDQAGYHTTPLIDNKIVGQVLAKLAA